MHHFDYYWKSWVLDEVGSYNLFLFKYYSLKIIILFVKNQTFLD